MSDIQKIVFENLDAAKQNAPEIFDWKVNEIAEDLIGLASDCEGFTVEQLTPYIENYLKQSAKTAHRLIAKTARSFDDLTPVFSAEEINQWYAENFAWRFVGDELPEPEEGVEYICVDDDEVYWLCEYDYNQHDEAVFTVLGSKAQPNQGSITHWMPKPPLPVKEK